jgi:hypothetical protein
VLTKASLMSYPSVLGFLKSPYVARKAQEDGVRGGVKTRTAYDHIYECVDFVSLFLRPGLHGWFLCHHEYPWVCDCGMWCVSMSVFVCQGRGSPCGVHMCWEGVMVRARLLLLLPHFCSHLALISRSLGREPRFRIQENVPGSGHCAEPCSGSPSGNCSRREGGREC